MHTMRDFLVRMKALTVKLNSLKSFKLVLGNESCDLDSAICSITYAYFLNYKTGVPVLPVFNVIEEEMPLKTEVVFYLNKNKVFLENLIYRDSLDQTLLKSLDLDIILVDHHILAGPWIELSKKVTEIIDHRPKDPKWNWSMNVRDVIQMVGSCATLIAKEIFNDGQFMQNKDLFVLAKPLHATIVLDTANFSKSAARAKELDFEIIGLLEQIIKVPDEEVQRFRLQIFNELMRAKTDISSLSTKQILSKDMKMAGRVPISGMPILIESYLQLPDAKEAILDFCQHYKTNITILMGMKIDGELVTRDIGIFCKNGFEHINEIISSLKNSKEPDLHLEQKRSSIEGLVLFAQGNVKATRKHIYPILKNAIEKISM